jgi:YD repeat-containing protein
VHATYDPQGRFVVATKDALGFVDHYTNDPAFGGLTSHTDPNAVTTSWSYDTFGRKTRETRADGTYTVIGYIPCPTGCPGIFEVQAIPYSPSAVQDGPMTASYFDMLGRDVEDIANGFVLRPSTPHARGFGCRRREPSDGLVLVG